MFYHPETYTIYWDVDNNPANSWVAESADWLASCPNMPSPAPTSAPTAAPTPRPYDAGADAHADD